MTLHLGDCLDVLKTLPDASVDAVVTDPPYELGFMGKKWDAAGIAYNVELWREALRVLKPGGHLLAFGGTRTYHRMACAIEDAGFEIRDSIHWVYSTGFPKSHNFGCKCREKPVPYAHDAAQEIPEHDLQGMRSADVPATLATDARGGALLFTGLSEQGAPKHGAKRTEPEIAGEEQPRMEGRRDVEAGAWELQGRSLCAMPAGVSGDGAVGWVCDGASTRHGSDAREGAASERGGASHRPQPVKQRRSKFDAVSVEPRTQTARGRCEACGGLTAWAGFGTALKPAHEPVVVARKPLAGTVADNVQAHGTGALNIDGCRVATTDNLNGGAYAETGGERHDGAESWRYKHGGAGEFKQPSGRWPPNLLLSHTPECGEACADSCPVAEMDRQSGTLKSGVHAAHHQRHAAGGNGQTHGTMAGVTGQSYGDSGGASRFFPVFRYQAKASRSERNAGLDGFPEALPLAPNGSPNAVGASRGSLSKPRANVHPTVKPVELMRWLVRLVTPPGGVVLDPFTGSGTTGVAATLEGFDFIGIEREPEYHAIATARIEYARGQQPAQAELFSA